MKVTSARVRTIHVNHIDVTERGDQNRRYIPGGLSVDGAGELQDGTAVSIDDVHLTPEERSALEVLIAGIGQRLSRETA